MNWRFNERGAHGLAHEEDLANGHLPVRGQAVNTMAALGRLVSC